MEDAVVTRIASQSGVVARRQLVDDGIGGSSLGEHDVARMIRRRELVVVHPGVYVNHTGSLTWLQRAWAAVLVNWPAALTHESALRAADGPGRRDNDEESIQVAVGRHRHLAPPPGVELHRLTRFDDRVLWNVGPPRLRYQDAALEVAGAMTEEFAMIGAISRACQSGHTTAPRMLLELADRPRIPRREWLQDLLTDVAEGTCSVLEHGYLHRVELAHGLPTGSRQGAGHTRLGRVYRDGSYQSSLVVELDGRPPTLRPAMTPRLDATGTSTGISWPRPTG